VQKVTFLVKPNAKTSSIGRGEDGRLWIRIACPPVEGKANKAVVEFLADYLDIPKSSISLVSGASSRIKTFAIEGPEIERLNLILH
jgi:uncharacterized protein (TIGR00251 family)